MAAVEQMAAAASTAWLPAPIPEVQVHMPKVTSDKRRAVLPAHDMRLPALFAAWAQSLTPDDVVLVNEFLRDGVGELNFGSMCSGSDIPALVVKAFADFCRDFWGAEPSFRHTFACEKDEHKRKFIAEVHAHVEHLFRDVHEMTQATAVDVKLDKAVPTPSSSVFAAGFPCQDCSALNPNASSDQNRSCIAQGSLRTGSVFHGIVTYLEGRMRRGDDPDVVLVVQEQAEPARKGSAAPTVEPPVGRSLPQGPMRPRAARLAAVAGPFRRAPDEESNLDDRRARVGPQGPAHPPGVPRRAQLNHGRTCRLRAHADRGVHGARRESSTCM